MRVLFCKCFGIGNAAMSVPAVKALATLGTVDVLVGSHDDDVGAVDVFWSLKRHCAAVRSIYIDYVGSDVRYDVAVLAIPYDGRWKNGVHFFADRVVDGRTRPDPSTTGLVSWKKHEAEYQMDDAVELGYGGPTQDPSFAPRRRDGDAKRLYVGVGHKKGPQWACKHWGTGNFTELVGELLCALPSGWELVATGDQLDMAMTLGPMKRRVQHALFRVDCCTVRRSIELAATCHAYVGNDTGMMHVLASFDVPVVAMFFMEGSAVKNPPLCGVSRLIDGTLARPTVEEVVSAVLEVIRADRP